MASTTVVSGGAITGNGMISGDVRFEGHSWLMPGNSPGVLTFENLELTAGSTSVIEVAPITAGAQAAAREPGLDHDQIKVTGKLQLQAGSTIEIKPWSGGDLARGEAIRQIIRMETA